MPNPAAGDLFAGGLLPSVLGAVWAWLLALVIGAFLLPSNEGVHDRARILVWIVVGVAVESQVWLLIGWLGALWPVVVLATAGGLTLLGAAVTGRRILREARLLWTPADAGARDPVGRWLRAAAVVATATFLLLVARLALWPTVFYDDLVYHVGLPRQALLTGSWPAMPGMHYSFMPAGWDALYLVPLSLGGGSGPQLMNVIGLSLFAWAAYRLARLGAGRGAASAITALLVIAPVTGSLGALAGNDLFVGLALAVAVERLVATSGSRPVLVGLLTGAAWCVKYTALPACAGVALGAVALRRRDGLGAVARAATIGAVTLAVPLGWTLRTLWLTGNPVYPAFFGLLGGRFWDDASAAAVAQDVSHGGLGDRGVLAFGTALYDLLFHSGDLGNPAGANPLFVVAGLAGLLLWTRVRGGAALLVIAVVTYLGWCATSLNLRYALILLALLAPFGAALVDGGLRSRAAAFSRLAGPVAAALVLLAVAGPFLDTAARHLELYGKGTPLFPGEPRAEMLTSRIHLAAAGRAMAEQLPPDARVLLVAEGRVGLLPRAALASSAYDMPDIARIARGAASVDELNRRLGEFGYVVVNFRELERFRETYGFGGRFEPATWSVFESWLRDGLDPLGRYGNVVVYRVRREVPA
jgi:hypothetical protein